MLYILCGTGFLMSLLHTPRKAMVGGGKEYPLVSLSLLTENPAKWCALQIGGYGIPCQVIEGDPACAAGVDALKLKAATCTDEFPGPLKVGDILLIVEKFSGGFRYYKGTVG